MQLWTNVKQLFSTKNNISVSSINFLPTLFTKILYPVNTILSHCELANPALGVADTNIQLSGKTKLNQDPKNGILNIF